MPTFAPSMLTAWLSLIGFLLWLGAPPVGAAAPSGSSASTAPAVVNLLALPEARLDDTGAPGAAEDVLRGLRDGELGRTVPLPAPTGQPTLLIGFGGNVVSLEGAEIFLGSAAADAARPTAVDILVSQVSPHAGFQSVRSETLKAVAGGQKLTFPAVAARWVMLKFRSSGDGRPAALAEVRLTGHEGAPQSRYRFNESPTAAFQVLRELEAGSGLDLSISADERRLFADAADGRLDDFSFAEAALIASGVVQANDRKPLLARIDRIVADARKAVAGGKTPFDKGAALLRHLHATTFSKGYRADQTRVSTLLTQNRFNCVSSAALYNIVGRQLGLDLRGIEVPDHALSILYDGTEHVDVETTTAGGFDPARNREAQANLRQVTGFAYIPDAHRDRRREVRETGLLALIVYNEGVELMREKRHAQALVAFFRAMSLDAEFGSAVQNALAVLANWSLELARSGRHEEATRIAALGVRLAPQDAALLNNRKYAWQQWADSLAREGRTGDALAVLRRAADAVPDAGFDRMQAWVFVSGAEKRIQAGDWNGARSVVEPALAAGLDPAARADVERWLADLPLRWSQEAMSRGRFDSALDVLAARLERPSPDPRIAAQIAYVAQEQLRDAARREGSAAADALVGPLLERFPGHDGVRQVALSQLQRSAVALSDAGRHEEAVAASDRIAALVDDRGAALKLRADLTDRWAIALSRERRWEPALDVYATAWPQLDDRSRARNNVRYLLQEWLKDAGTEPQAARAILERTLPRFGDVPGLEEIGRNHVALRVQTLARDGQYEPALAAVAAFQPLLKAPQAAAALALPVYDRWSQQLMERQQWQAATDVYERGLRQFPGNAHLENNAAVAWDRWARTFIDRKDWPAAIDVYERGLGRLPGNRLLEQNRRYCQEQQRQRS